MSVNTSFPNERQMTLETVSGDHERPVSTGVGQLRGVDGLADPPDVLMHAVAEALRCLIANSNFETAIHRAMRMVGEAAKIHRFKVILSRQASQSEDSHHELAYEWFAPFLRSQASYKLTHFEDALIRPYVGPAKLGKSQWQLIDDVEGPLRAPFEQVGMLSMGVVPVFAGSTYAGVVAFDDCQRRREWTPREIDALTIAAQGIGTAIYHRELVQRDVAAARRREESVAHLLSSLRRGVSAVAEAESLPDGLQRIFLEICRASGADEANLFSYDSLSNTLGSECWFSDGSLHAGFQSDAPPLLRGRFDADVTPGFRQTMAADHVLCVVDHTSMDSVTREMAWPGVIEWHCASGRRSSCSIVLCAKSIPYGVVGLAWRDAFEFTPEQRETLGALCSQAVLVWQLRNVSETRTRLTLTEERRKLAEQKAFEAERSSTALQATVDALQYIAQVEEIVPRVLSIVADAFGAEACAAYENEPDGLIRLKYWHVDRQTMTPSRLLESGRLEHETATVVQSLAEGFKVPDSYLGTAAAGAIGVFVLDHRLGTSVPEFDEFAVRNRWDLELNIGVGSQGVRRWTLCIYRQSGQPFTPVEQSLAESLAKQMALAVGMARLAAEAGQAALALERQRAAEQMTAQLAKANEGLHESARRLVRGSSVNDILPVTLLAAMECAGAVAGAVLRRVGESTEFVFVLISQDGQLLAGEQLENHPFTVQVRELSRADRGRHFHRISHGEAVWYLSVSDTTTDFTEAQRWHAPRGQSAIWDVPFVIGGRVAGYLGLAFAHAEPPSEYVRQTVGALATQVGLALEMTDLANAAHSAVVARERESFARERARESERRAVMLAAIAAASRDLQEADDFEQGLVAWLGRVSSAAGADAAGLGEYHLSPRIARVVPTIRAAWATALRDVRVAPEDDSNEVPDTTDFAQWTERILRGEIVWANYSDLKDPASRRYWDSEGCAGHVLVPVPLAGDDKGFLSFDFFTERPYDAELVATIRTAADGLSSAMRRHAAHQAQLAERDAHAMQVHKANTALQATIDAVTDLQTLDAIMPRVLEIFADAFDAIGVGYFENSRDLIHHRFWLHDGQLLPTCGLPDLSPEHLAVAQRLADGFTVPIGHLGGDFRTRSRPSIVHHRTATASPELHAFARSRGWDWEINVPLFVNDHSDAAITLFRAEDRPFTDSDCSLAESLAKQIALARQVSRVGERDREVTIARERAAELARANLVMRRVNDLVASERNPEAVVSHVLRELTELVGADAAALFHYEEDRRQIRFGVGYDSGRIVDELVGHPYGHRDRPAPLDDFPAWDLLACGRRQLFSSVTLDLTVPPSNEWHRARGHKMLALSALFVADKPIGMLGLAFAGEEALSAAQLESFSALAQQMTLAIQFVRLAEQAQTASLLEERNRIARDLHDTMAQSFTGIYMQLQAAGRYSESNQLLARACIDRAQTLARDGLRDARRSVLSLASGSELMDLASAVSSVADLASTGTPCPCTVRIEGESRPIDSHVGGNVVAICREAIGNAQRYSEATTLALTIRYLPDELEVQIADNGRGFSLPESAQSGFGLAGMHARALRVDGQLRIVSAPGAGTTVVLRAPIRSGVRAGQAKQ